jgi:hypothetical protein
MTSQRIRIANRPDKNSVAPISENIRLHTHCPLNLLHMAVSDAQVKDLAHCDLDLIHLAVGTLRARIWHTVTFTWFMWPLGTPRCPRGPHQGPIGPFRPPSHHLFVPLSFRVL